MFNHFWLLCLTVPLKAIVLFSSYSSFDFNAPFLVSPEKKTFRVTTKKSNQQTFQILMFNHFWLLCLTEPLKAFDLLQFLF